MINFGIIGAGWRSEFYIRIAQLMPDKFKATGIYIRNTEKAREFSEKYTVKIFTKLDDLLKTNSDFFVSCVNKYSICNEIELLCNMGNAVLSETPIGTSISQIENFKKRIKPEWRIQVSEQYHFLPRNQAFKAIIDSGILGKVHQVQLSCCHDYHAISLIRYFLELNDEMPKITTVTLNDTVTRYNSRTGLTIPAEINSQQKIAILNYRNKTAVYDFSSAQYFSDIRNSRIIIRGTNGEIVNNTCTYLHGTTPIKFDLIRNHCGTNENLDGFYLDSISGNGTVLYKNPFLGARLTDEEIAIATCLTKMYEYLVKGNSFYPLKEAITDSETAFLL